MKASSNAVLLLGSCVCCGEPLFRHRKPNGRQISCARLRAIDEAFKANHQRPQHPLGALHQLPLANQSERQVGVR